MPRRRRRKDDGINIGALLILLIIGATTFAETLRNNQQLRNTLLFWGMIALIFFGGLALTNFVLNRKLAEKDRIRREEQKKLDEEKRLAWLRAQNQLDTLILLDPTQFELRVVQLFKDLHYQVEHRGKTGDGGVDLTLLAKDGTRWVIQCKRYAKHKNVGQPEIRDLFGTMMHENADRASLITTSDFTPKAREFAEGKPITLINGDELIKLLEKSK